MKKTLLYGLSMATAAALALAPFAAGAEGLHLGQGHGSHGSGGSVTASTSVQVQASLALPLGILHAPGIQRRMDDGKSLPPGLLNRNTQGNENEGNGQSKDNENGEGNATSTEHAAIAIQNLRAVSGTTTATVSWDTSVLTTGSLSYTASNLSASTTVSAGATSTLAHSVMLSGLAPNSTYFYMVTAQDVTGMVKQSAMHSFRTKAVDTTPPMIVFSGTFDVSSTTARIIWFTNELSDGRIWLGTSAPVNMTGTPAQSSASLSYYHEFDFSGLATSTPFFFSFASSDAAANTATSSGQFTTLAH